MGEGVLYRTLLFTEFPFKAVSGDVTAFHRILYIPPAQKLTSISKQAQNNDCMLLYGMLLFILSDRDTVVVP